MDTKDGGNELVDAMTRFIDKLNKETDYLKAANLFYSGHDQLLAKGPTSRGVIAALSPKAGVVSKRFQSSPSLEGKRRSISKFLDTLKTIYDASDEILKVAYNSTVVTIKSNQIKAAAAYIASILDENIDNKFHRTRLAIRNSPTAKIWTDNMFGHLPAPNTAMSRYHSILARMQHAAMLKNEKINLKTPLDALINLIKETGVDKVLGFIKEDKLLVADEKQAILFGLLMHANTEWCDAGAFSAAINTHFPDLKQKIHDAAMQEIVGLLDAAISASNDPENPKIQALTALKAALGVKHNDIKPADEKDTPPSAAVNVMVNPDVTIWRKLRAANAAIAAQSCCLSACFSFFKDGSLPILEKLMLVLLRLGHVEPAAVAQTPTVTVPPPAPN